MEYQRITNVLGNIPEKKLNFFTKKRIEVHDLAISYHLGMIQTKQTNKIENINATMRSI